MKRSDTDRLDWLDTHQAMVQYRTDDPYDPWRVITRATGTNAGESLRKAIDGAMNRARDRSGPVNAPP